MRFRRLNLSFLAIPASLVGFMITILWLVIGWRAMRAHESLALSQSSIETDLRRIAQSLSKEQALDSSPPKKIAEIDLSALPKFSE